MFDWTVWIPWAALLILFYILIKIFEVKPNG
jgi:hypothetical protein